MLLPVLPPAGVRAASRRLAREHRTALAAVVGIQALATVAGLVGPRVLGHVVDSVARGAASTALIDRAVLLFAAALVVQTVLTRVARLRGATLGEEVLAHLREQFLSRTLALPLDVAENAGTGDLLTRATTDVDKLTYAVRRAVPEILVALVASALTAAALVTVAPLLALPCVVAAPIVVVATRWYRRRAPEGYRREMQRSADVIGRIAETVDAGRTVEAYRLGPRRRQQTDDDIREWIAAERYTMFLRTIWFPSVEVGFVVPIAGTLLLGGLLHAHGVVSLGQVTAAVLYVQLLLDPIDTVISWLDELQIGSASLARILGVGEVPPADESALPPRDDRIEAAGVRFAYRPGHDVLHGVDLDVRPGVRLAVVGPSGAGKTTIGRLLAGVHAPRTGTVQVGGSDVARLTTAVRRTHVALVTQEQHVFAGTLRDNLLLTAPGAADAVLLAALDAVDAGRWARALPLGLDTPVGGRSEPLSPGQAQQLGLARLVLADPHTLVLDEATSLLDPRAARHLEKSLAAVLDGRTVVAIAHRLHTAHDADLVAVVIDGRIAEYGTHDDLVAADGAYADLWRSWHGTSAPAHP